jgi:hypothetical protein
MWLTRSTLDRRIVWQSEYFVERLTRPIFVEHFFFGDQSDVAALGFAGTHEIAALKKGGEANYVDWF